MKKNITITKTLILILTTFLIQSCFVAKAVETPKMRSEFSVKNGAIPINFGKNESEVLLIQYQYRSSKNRFMKKAAQKEYKGEYQIVKHSTDIDTAFPDKKKYRYVFDSVGGSYTSSGILFLRYHIYDRLEDKIYSSGAEFTFFAKALKIYMENLNNQRIKNQK